MSRQTVSILLSYAFPRFHPNFGGFRSRSKFWLILAFFPWSFVSLQHIGCLAVLHLVGNIFSYVKTELANITCCRNCSESYLSILKQFVERDKEYFFKTPLVKLQWGNITRSLKHRNGQCHIFLLVCHITKCSFWLPDLARGATMIEPYSIFAFCMIDNMPPKVSFRKSGLLAFGYVATYLCSSTCITSERTILWLALKLYIIYPDRHRKWQKWHQNLANSQMLAKLLCP